MSPSILNCNLAEWSKLDCRFSPFKTLNISLHPLLDYNISVEKSVLALWGFTCN